jgi:hypothetical protein
MKVVLKKFAPGQLCTWFRMSRGVSCRIVDVEYVAPTPSGKKHRVRWVHLDRSETLHDVFDENLEARRAPGGTLGIDTMGRIDEMRSLECR